MTEDENKELNRFILDLVDKYVRAENRFLDLVFEMSDQEGMTKEDAKSYIEYLGTPCTSWTSRLGLCTREYTSMD